MTASLFPGLTVPRSGKATYRRRAMAIILRKGMRGEVTADDVHALLPCPDDVDPKNLGLAFNSLAQDGIIEPIRFATSTRAIRHAGLYRVWRVCDAKSARQYLRALATTGDDYAG